MHLLRRVINKIKNINLNYSLSTEADGGHMEEYRGTSVGVLGYMGEY